MKEKQLIWSGGVFNWCIHICTEDGSTPYNGLYGGAPPKGVGSFSIDDGNGSENVSFKMNSRFFKLCRVYSSLLKMASVGEFPWS